MMELKGNCLWEYETFHKPERFYRLSFKQQLPAACASTAQRAGALRLIYDLWKMALVAGEYQAADKIASIYHAVWYSI